MSILSKNFENNGFMLQSFHTEKFFRISSASNCSVYSLSIERIVGLTSL